jgi:hypothetical protein
MAGHAGNLLLYRSGFWYTDPVDPDPGPFRIRNTLQWRG